MVEVWRDGWDMSVGIQDWIQVRWSALLVDVQWLCEGGEGAYRYSGQPISSSLVGLLSAWV